MFRTLLFILVLLHGISASALTVTFDDIQPAIKPIPAYPDTYTENGVTASSPAGLGYWSRVGAIHLDDSGTGIASTVGFTTGGLFNPVSFDIFALGTTVFSDILNLVDGTETTVLGIPYDDVRILGLRNGEQVAEERFSSAAFSTYFFNPHEFLDIDKLIISAVYPESSFFESMQSDLQVQYPDYLVEVGCFGGPCSHFDIDNLTLNPARAVTEPASLSLLLLGLLLLLIARRTKMPKTPGPI